LSQNDDNLDPEAKRIKNGNLEKEKQLKVKDNLNCAVHMDIR
jgi:hypothetical protein